MPYDLHAGAYSMQHCNHVLLHSQGNLLVGAAGNGTQATIKGVVGQQEEMLLVSHGQHRHTAFANCNAAAVRTCRQTGRHSIPS